MKRWDDLRLFLSVARHGTLAGAASELGFNASTLHRRLAELEGDFGVVLFEKSPRGYRLSTAGEALLSRTEEVEEAVFAAQRAVLGNDQQVSGEVRFTLPPDLIPAIRPHLNAFRAVCGGIRPVLIGEDAHLDLGRTADIALRASQTPPEAAVGRKIATLGWCRYTSATAGGEALPWLHYSQSCQLAPVKWRRQVFGATEPLMLVNTVHSMHLMLPGTGAQALLPCFLGDPDPRLRRVSERIPATTTLWLLIHADLRRAARVRALVDFLVPRLLGERELFEG